MNAAKNEQFEVNGQALAHRRWQVCATSRGPLRLSLRDQSQLKCYTLNRVVSMDSPMFWPNVST